MFTTISKLYALLDRRARWHIGLLAIPMLGMAVLEMASIGLVLPLVQALMSNGDDAVSGILGRLLPNMAAAERLELIALVFVAVFLIKNCAYIMIAYLINWVIHNRSAEFIQRMFELYVHRPLRFHLARNSAEIVRNLTTGCYRAFEAIRIIMTVGLEVVLVLATVGLLFAIQPMITLVAATALVLIAFVYYRFSSPVFARWGAHVQRLDGDMIKGVNQTFGSIRDVKILHCGGAQSQEFGRFALEKARYLVGASTMQNVPRLLLETVMIVFMVGMIIVLTGEDGSVTEVIATLGLFGMASLRLMPSMSRIMQGAGEFRNRTAYVDTIHQDLIEGMRDNESELAASQREDLPFRRDLVLEGINFRHPNSDTLALKEIDLTIGCGESIGIVGPSGAGKTTLLDIVMGLLKPDSGSMRVDGVDVKSQLGAWQRHIGYVPQQVYLNDDTLRRNIAFGLPDNMLSDDRRAEILKLAQLQEVVAGMPDGLDTVLGEHGVRLSGGERQRVAIARALSRDPDVLVFDEATSALDNETERLMTRAIESMAGKKTIIIIAHRLSTVRSCTKLVFLNQGQIAAVGPFEELVETNSEFRRLAELGGLSNVASPYS
jgi:ATP-binding cassette, subfamily B, bacterial PglK